MKNKPKIAILSIRNSYGFGGVFATLKVVHDFCGQYFEPTVFYLSFDSEISAHLKGFKFHASNRESTFFGMHCIEIGSKWAFWEPGHYSYTKERWHEALEGFDYFFVVSATPIAAHPLVILNKKFVLWISTPYDQDRSERVKQLKGIRKIVNAIAEPCMRIIERKILNRATNIIALSSYSRNEFLKILGRNKRTISVCGYPLSTTITPNLEKNFKSHLIIAVGRFSDPRKNIVMLLDAFKKIHAKIPQARLCIIGKEPLPEIIHPYLDESFFDAITFTGQITPNDLHRFYQDASLMLVTSYQEGFGIAALESAYSGTPVITTDCGGIRDFVINGYNGYVVAINDSSAMANRAIELLQNKNLLQEFSYNGHHLSDALFKQSKVYSHFKQALINTYPNLAKHFSTIDADQICQKTVRETQENVAL